MSDSLVERVYVMRDVQRLFTLINEPDFHHEAEHLSTEVLNYIITNNSVPIDYHEMGPSMLGNRIIPIFEGMEVCSRTVIAHIRRCVTDEVYHRNQTELLIYALRAIHNEEEPVGTFLQDYSSYLSPIILDERPLGVSPMAWYRASRLFNPPVDPAITVQMKRGRRQALRTIEELYGREIAKFVKKGYPIAIESPTGQLFMINTVTGRVYNKDWAFLCIDVGRDVVLTEDRIMILISVIRSGLIYLTHKEQAVSLEGLEDLVATAVR